MSGAPRKRAQQKYRSRLIELGMARFEVLGLDADHGEIPPKGRILVALRRSPLVGSDLDLARVREEGRRVDL
jgi:hypothetical protein